MKHVFMLALHRRSRKGPTQKIAKNREERRPKTEGSSKSNRLFLPARAFAKLRQKDGIYTEIAKVAKEGMAMEGHRFKST
jgi:hypothetical protein